MGAFCKPLGRLRYSWQNNIKMDMKEKIEEFLHLKML
jgi:hypothetical protein